MRHETNPIFSLSEEISLEANKKNQGPSSKEDANEKSSEPLRAERLLRQVRAMIPKGDKSS